MAVWAGLPMLHLSGPAAHRRVSAATCRAQLRVSVTSPWLAWWMRWLWWLGPDGWVPGPLDAQVNPLGGGVGGVADVSRVLWRVS